MKKKYPKQEDIPEALRPYYTEKDGEWHITVEGMVPSEKVTEFRDNNVTLTTENTKLKADLVKFENVDVDKYRELLGKENDLRDEKLFSKNKIDELVNTRTEEMRREHTNQNAALVQRAEKAEKEASQLKDNLKRQVIDRTVIDAGVKLGLEPTGHLDLVNRARAVADLDETGKLVFKNADGTRMYGKDGVTPMTAEEWAERQATTEAKHLFKPSNGGGAGPGGGGGGGGGGSADVLGKTAVIDGRTYGTGENQYNPFNPKTKNLSDQGKVITKDKALAEAMAKAVGKSLPAALV
jgi:hypothetical protein